MPEIGFKRPMVAAITVTLAFVFSMTLLLQPQEAFAVDYVISDEASCEAAAPFTSPNWTDATSTCEVSFFDIDSGDTVTVNPGITLIGDGLIDGPLNNAGTFVAFGVTVVGTFNNTGTTENNGTFTNGNIAHGTVINTGTIINNNFFAGHGDGLTIINNGTIINNNGGELAGSGSGSVINNGTIINNNGGEIGLPFIFTNNGIITNNGTITVQSSLTLTNNGVLNYDCAGTIESLITTTGNAPVDICEPAANSQSTSIDEDTVDAAITINGINPEVAGNPFANANLTFFILTPPQNGALAATGVNTTTSAGLTFTPNPNFAGSDSFTFITNDGTNDSPAAAVSITINSLNDAPAADSQNVATNEDTALQITLTGSDVETATGSLTFSIDVQPENGTLSGTEPNMTYTPSANFTGSDSFTFVVNDGTVNSTAATVSITITAANDAPVADSQSVTTDEDENVEITLTGTDVEGSTLTFSIVTDPAKGTLSGFNSTTGEVTYTPDTNFNGADSFTFVVNDGTDNSAAATVSITVNPVAEEEDDDEDDDRRRSGGGGGGKRVVIINNQGDSSSVTTFPESYFADNPLHRIGVSNSSLLDALETSIDVATVGQQVSITGTLSNHQQAAQDYAFIVQIIDEDGVVIFFGFQNGNIDSGQTADISLSWMPEAAGDYTVKIFVWDSLQPPAQPLSTVTGMNIEVTE